MDLAVCLTPNEKCRKKSNDLRMYVPWKQNVDLTVVIVVMADAKKALSVTLNCHAEQPRIHSLNLADMPISQVLNHIELGIEKPGQGLASKIGQN